MAPADQPHENFVFLKRFYPAVTLSNFLEVITALKVSLSGRLF